ncbi:hypothetical protein LDL59_06055 [Kaistella anthropi]|nr:hypothetical protein [Kaistella anthropi]
MNSNVISRYDDYQFINEEKFNLMKIGRIWTGDAIIDSKTLTFTTKSPMQSSDVIRYRSRVVAYQSAGNKITTTINNQNSYTSSILTKEKKKQFR